jgi:hypothetical protein
VDDEKLQKIAAELGEDEPDYPYDEPPPYAGEDDIPF